VVPAKRIRRGPVVRAVRPSFASKPEIRNIVLRAKRKKKNGLLPCGKNVEEYAGKHGIEAAVRQKSIRMCKFKCDWSSGG